MTARMHAVGALLDLVAHLPDGDLHPLLREDFVVVLDLRLVALLEIGAHHLVNAGQLVLDVPYVVLGFDAPER